MGMEINLNVDAKNKEIIETRIEKFILKFMGMSQNSHIETRSFAMTGVDKVMITTNGIKTELKKAFNDKLVIQLNKNNNEAIIYVPVNGNVEVC